MSSAPNIGDLLVAWGLVDREQIDRALALQAQRPDTRIGTLLVELGACPRSALERTLAKQMAMRAGEVPGLADVERLADYAAELLERRR